MFTLGLSGDQLPVNSTAPAVAKVTDRSWELSVFQFLWLIMLSLVSFAPILMPQQFPHSVFLFPEVQGLSCSDGCWGQLWRQTAMQSWAPGKEQLLLVLRLPCLSLIQSASIGSLPCMVFFSVSAQLCESQGMGCILFTSQHQFLCIFQGIFWALSLLLCLD